jgi:predicted dinucleotide-binding enzyme
MADKPDRRPGMRQLLFTFLALALVLTALAAPAGARQTVAVIGTGDMGDSLGPRFAELGYRVVYGSRSPQSDKVRNLVAQTGHGATAALPQQAAAAADIVVLAVGWPAMETAAQSLGSLDGKIVIDISMPFKQGQDGYPELLLETSSAQMIQRWHPGARVVKTFATMGSQLIDDPMAEGGPVSIPVASDDRAAREEVAGIVARMGLDPVDFGPLRMARYIESLQMIYMIPLVQNRPHNWEFHFRRSEYYGCYRSGESTTEGLVPPYDDGDFARFPALGDNRKSCP